MQSSRGAVLGRMGACAAVAALAAAPGVAIASGAAHRKAHRASVTTVGSTKNKNLGKILVNSRGYTLYTFTGRSCSGACAKVWKPLKASGSIKAKAGSGVNQKWLSSSKGQVTYNKHALYLFPSKDKKPGQVNGQNKNQFGGHWYVVGTNGKPIKPNCSSTPPPQSCLPGGY